MVRKYGVTFSSPTQLSQSVVFVSPSATYPGKFSVAVLYPTSTSGSFQSTEGILRSFDLCQELLVSDEKALAWASEWLNEKLGYTSTLYEVVIR